VTFYPAFGATRPSPPGRVLGHRSVPARSKQLAEHGRVLIGGLTRDAGTPGASSGAEGVGDAETLQDAEPVEAVHPPVPLLQAGIVDVS
jgi:hypothetical protein